MEQSFLRDKSHSASQEIPSPLWNPKAHYRVHKIPRLVPILGQMNTVNNFPPYFPKNHSNMLLFSVNLLHKDSENSMFHTSYLFSVV